MKVLKFVLVDYIEYGDALHGSLSRQQTPTYDIEHGIHTEGHDDVEPASVVSVAAMIERRIR